MADPVVHITAGIPDGGTGNITTLGQTLLDGANATLGITTGAAVTTSAAGTLQQYLRGIVSLLVSGITVATHAVTQSGSWVLSAGSALIGIVKIGDGTTTAVIKAASTAPVATDPALVVALSPNGLNVNGRATPSASAPFVLNSMTYTAVAASQTAALFGATGASGDYLDGVLIIPATAAAGAVTITDGSGSAITIFAGGGTTALPTLAPFFVPIGAISKNGAGGWKVTTGANVSVIGVGNFT